MSDETKKLCSNADTCDWCGAYSTTDRCSGCREARYCGKRCQASHWAEHRGLCLQIRAEREKKERRKQLGVALYSASFHGKAPEVRSLLLSGADPRYSIEGGKYKGLFPLYVASQNGHVEVIDALVAGGADPNQVGGRVSGSSLFMAAQHNQPRAIAALVKANADVNLASSSGCTPLNKAVQHGNKEAVVALLVARAAVNIANDQGASPLFFAAQRGHVDILKLLLRAKAEVNQANIYGVTPLMMAVYNGHLACVELLLAGGANVHDKDNNGHTALDYAIHFKKPAVEAVLRAHIAQLEAAGEAEAEAAGK